MSFVPSAAVGAVGVPVKEGDAIVALKAISFVFVVTLDSRAVILAVLEAILLELAVILDVFDVTLVCNELILEVFEAILFVLLVIFVAFVAISLVLAVILEVI